MARKKATITITAEGRDQGKVFVLEEMPCDQAERYLLRAIHLLKDSGIKDIPESGESAADLSTINLSNNIAVTEALADPSLDDCWQCVKYSHKPNQPLQPIKPGINSQIEEVSTRTELRQAVYNLHLGFLLPDETPITETRDGMRSIPRVRAGA
jgi:hypothetical protein